jgi:hypothetical protein
MERNEFLNAHGELIVTRFGVYGCD